MQTHAEGKAQGPFPWCGAYPVFGSLRCEVLSLGLVRRKLRIVIDLHVSWLPVEGLSSPNARRSLRRFSSPRCIHEGNMQGSFRKDPRTLLEGRT